MNKDILNVDIKRDYVFKNVFLREVGRKLMCYIISDLYNLDLVDLINNLKFYNSEHPRLDSKIYSSYSDIVYQFRNKIFIVEMNKSYYESSIYKNHFYLLFRHVFDANNKNNYNQEKETYLIDIDNYDIRKELKNENCNRFISHGKLTIEDDNICIYKNIRTTRINLDYLKRIKYNYGKLTNIERNCLIFIEKEKRLLKKYGNYNNIKGVIELLEVIEINGKYYPKFDKEAWEETLRNEMKERGLKEGREEGIKEERRVLALKLKEKNFSLETIRELTGLSIKQIKNL